jgi:hypothetical protein
VAWSQIYMDKEVDKMFAKLEERTTSAAENLK